MTFSIEYLPDDVLGNILKRSHSIDCRLVCKKWCKLLDVMRSIIEIKKAYGINITSKTEIDDPTARNLLIRAKKELQELDILKNRVKSLPFGQAFEEAKITLTSSQGFKHGWVEEIITHIHAKANQSKNSTICNKLTKLLEV